MNDDVVMHRVLKENKKGVDYFIGDLHGQVSLLKKFMLMVNFDSSRDRIICTGDLVDRGDSSLECLRLLETDWFYSVLGNHEDFILSSDDISSYKRAVWERNGGSWWFSLTKQEQCECKNLLIKNVSLSITVQANNYRLGVIHSEVPMKKWPLERNSVDIHRHEILWGRNVIVSSDPNFIRGVDFIISGHTPVDVPKLVGNQLFIDTGSGYSPNEKINNPHLTACNFLNGEVCFFHASSVSNKKSRMRIVN